MNFLPEVHFPFSNPIAIFVLVLLVILLSPIVLKRFKIPGIVGMIISGIILGPKGLNLLPYDSSIILLGTIGLLYLMFLAGLELNLNEFKQIKYQSLLFTALLFVVGTSLVYFTSTNLFNYTHIQSIFMGILLIPFTLISYPIVSRLGITRERIITLAVGTVVFADIASLFSITIIKEFAVKPDVFGFAITKFVIFSSLFLLFVIYAIPRISRWFFKNIEEVGTWQYIFVLLMLFSTAFFAELVGLEPIIGAFAAGLALNKYIPHNSTLMDRINFVGNSLFIPFFLIQIGMIIDITVFFKGYGPILIAITLLFLRYTALRVSAEITGFFHNYSKIEKKLLVGFVFSEAAATLAIAFIGFNIGLFDETLLNIVVVMILISCIAASFWTERYGKELVTQKEAGVKHSINLSQKILVSVANPKNISRLIEFGIRIKQPASINPIIILTIANNDQEIPEKILQCQKNIGEIVPNISLEMMKNIIVTSRASLNITDGIIRTIHENMVTDVVLGLSPKTKVSSRFFGDILQNLLEDTNKALYVFRSNVPLNLINKLIVFLPKNAEYEVGFAKLLGTLFTFANNLDMDVNFHCFPKTSKVVQNYINSNRVSVSCKFNEIQSYDDLDKFTFSKKDEDMLICVFSRPKGISYDLQYRNFVERQLDETENSNFALFYPEQTPTFEEQDITHFDILDTSPIEENIVNYRTLVKRVKKLLGKN